MDVKRLIELFIAQLEAEVRDGSAKPATVEWYRSQLMKLQAVAAEVLADQLRLPHIVTVKQTHHFVRAIKRLYAWAVDAELLGSNPFRKLKIPKCGARERTLTRSEFNALLKASSADFRRYLILCSHTLARPGEIRELTWAVIDFEKRIIRLRDFKAKERRRDGLKARLIPLDEVALKLLAWMKARARSGFVFDSRRGTPFTANAIRCRMREARERAGLGEVEGEKVVCYHMRHTSATKALRNGVGIKHLAELLGHSRVTTTERYCHLDETDLVNVIGQATK